jgi:hypothetical protein
MDSPTAIYPGSLGSARWHGRSKKPGLHFMQAPTPNVALWLQSFGRDTEAQDPFRNSEAMRCLGKVFGGPFCDCADCASAVKLVVAGKHKPPSPVTENVRSVGDTCVHSVEHPSSSLLFLPRLAIPSRLGRCPTDHRRSNLEEQESVRGHRPLSSMLP